ncbi:hypothetical protein NDU88_012421 [Pleurodeles waltl]|uniref:Protein CutA homolog n=1 Tax=Pleurodeles waltl TaxID=8319 RepID=A0AAV7R1V9_PLEWA|nr:hypothetical protein NDU88_012421 [Pleurodeles waltl]
MDWLPQRLQLAAPGLSRHGTLAVLLVMICSCMMYPVLKSVSLQVHSALTGSYIAGRHSVSFINCPNEEIAKDIARAIMERKLAASVNIMAKSNSLYFWKGEIEEATEILLLVKTKTSKINELADYVRSIHPFEIPEILSFPIDQGNPAYLRLIDESLHKD